MKLLCALVLLAGCDMYFGTGAPPDATFLPDSGGRCPAVAPESGEDCGYHQSYLTCTYDNSPYTICRCASAAEYVWQCAEARFDAGVDTTLADAAQR